MGQGAAVEGECAVIVDDWALNMAEVPVAVLAGGLASRLGGIASRVPKALVEVAGRPFIDHQLMLLHRHGARRVVLCVGHLGERVEEHVGDGRRFGLSVAYTFDGPAPVGTAGALRQALPMLGDLFWVLYGDSYTDFDFAAALDAFAKAAPEVVGLMTVLKNDARWDRSNAEFTRGRLLRYDKSEPTAEMTYIDYGVSLLRREALAGLPAGTFVDLADVCRDLVATGRMIGRRVPVRRRFFEIGTPDALAETRRIWSEFLGKTPHLSRVRRRRTLRSYEVRWDSTMTHTQSYLAEAVAILDRLDVGAIERVLDRLVAVREQGGRLFLLGVGGSAANASHAVNDFRKIAGFEAYCADGQRFGTHRLDQRRELGCRLRRMAARQPFGVERSRVHSFRRRG